MKGYLKLIKPVKGESYFELVCEDGVTTTNKKYRKQYIENLNLPINKDIQNNPTCIYFVEDLDTFDGYPLRKIKREAIEAHEKLCPLITNSTQVFFTVIFRDLQYQSEDDILNREEWKYITVQNFYDLKMLSKSSEECYVLLYHISNRWVNLKDILDFCQDYKELIQEHC